MIPFYKDDLVTLYNGDCEEIMDHMVNEGRHINKVITSPPYNIVRPSSTDRGYDIYKDGMTNEQYIDWTVRLFNLYDKLLAENGCVLYNMSYGSENTECMNLTVAEILKRTCFTLADIIVWKKNSATPNNVSPNKMTRICEYIYVFVRRGEFSTFKTNKKEISVSETGQSIYENVFNYFQAPNNDESQDLNKATFSTKMVGQLMDRYVQNEDVVLDNFSGTGTTLVECVSRGVKGIGIELSKAQCNHTIKRIESGVQTTLL